MPEQSDELSTLALLVRLCPEFLFPGACVPLSLSPCETSPLCCRWPFCGSRRHCWAVTSALSSLLLVPHCPPPYLYPVFPFPLPLSMCLVSCVWQRCHYRAAHITPPPMSCLSAPRLSLALLSSLLFSPPASSWWLCVTFIPETFCPSPALPIMPCAAATLSSCPAACPQAGIMWMMWACCESWPVCFILFYFLDNNTGVADYQ